jgi:glycosyltransferase involved in cell wall biosynthesis
VNAPFFTVFTPVYNRRPLLHRVWDSLRAQTDRDFEWIVVDDGSTDGVGELLDEYRRLAGFPMTVLTQENCGKHLAWNRAVAAARGTLFVPADSDDEFVPETLARFRALWASIPAGDRARFSGINVLCRDQNGVVVGNRFPGDPLVSDNLELYYRYRVRGEKWGCLRTDLLRLRPFPDIRGRGNFSENWLFYWLARRYRVLCANEVLRIYYVDLTDSISSSLRARTVARAEADYRATSWNLGANAAYILRYQRWHDTLRNFVGLWRLGLLTGRGPRTILRELESRLARVCALAVLPPAWAFYAVTWRRLRRQAARPAAAAGEGAK